MGNSETVWGAQPENLETVYQGHSICSKSVCQEKDRQTAFYSPLNSDANNDDAGTYDVKYTHAKDLLL